MAYSGKTNWTNNEIVEASDMNRIEQGILDVDAELGNVQTALDGKVDDSQVLTNVPANAKFTDTVTTINGKTGAIAKADITALGIPAQDTVYTHPATHPASMITDLPTGKKVARFVIGTSTAGWTAADCDYLCDGTADQTEINAAITALPATGGEVVILDGTYNITAKIDVTKDNVSIRGNGNATILKRMFDSSVEEGVITLISRSGCKIANLQIDGNKSSPIPLYDFGIYLSSSSNNTVTGNTCNNNNSSGIYLSSSSNNNTITGNTCNNNNSSGIYLGSSSNNNTITGNTCSNNDFGIYLGSSSNNTVTGNTSNNNSYGIYLRGSNNTVTGNTYNNNDEGIYLNKSNNNTVTGNTCIRGTGLATDYTTNQHTIRLQGTNNNYNLISNNNCMGKAVTNGGGTGNTLVNNKFDAT
jgi:parallel beta-helix repeat protein